MIDIRKDVLSYDHPPITEAVIQIRVKNDIDQKTLEKIANKLKRNYYPNLKQTDKIDVNVMQNQSDTSAEINRKFEDYRLSSDDQADIVILQSNSLIISRLAPYPGWDVFHERFSLVWKIWKRIVKKQDIDRVGVRYINRIDIPTNESDKINIHDFLNFYPNDCIFTDIPMTDYFIQINKKTSNPLWSTTIISTQQPSPLIKTISLLLDIDISRTQEMPLNDEGLLLMLMEAREIKNQIFKQCVTYKTEELFN